MSSETLIESRRVGADSAAASYDKATASRATAPDPEPWHLPPRAIAWRLFVTSWLVFVLHFATDIVREHYPALALGDRFSFRLDEYRDLHPDLFEKSGYGWHIGNNPGVSMLAAIPYALSRPIIESIANRVQLRRAAAGLNEPPAYNTTWPNARRFYAEAWRRGLDIKLGLAALVMQALCMAPSSAAAVVLLFFVLRQIFLSDRTALWLSLLYAVGTPVLFRSGFLNHNLMLGHIAFAGLVALWNPGGIVRWRSTMRYILAGVAAGAALLFDYSGAVFILGLFAYGIVKRLQVASAADSLRHGAWYVVGTLGPVLLLWLYQWRSFGNPFLPGQHWMPHVEWIERGYQGYSGPQLDLIWALAFDHRFGLFVSAPLLLLGLAAPWLNLGVHSRLPRLELFTMLALFVALWVFFSGSNYTRLQYNTGVRYMAPIFPFLFVPAAIVLMRLRMRVIYFLSVIAITLAWSLAMYREVEHPLGILYPVVRLFIGGFTLPVLTTLSMTSGQYGDFASQGVSPLPLFVLTSLLIYGLWSRRLAAHLVRQRYPGEGNAL